MKRLLFILLFISHFISKAQTDTFHISGYAQTDTVPAGVYSVYVDAVGGTGGYSIDNAFPDSGGYGGRVQCLLSVTPGQVLYVFVGGGGGPWPSLVGGGGNSGESGNGSYTYVGGSGGGASDIRIGGTALTNRIVVAGGGGGGAAYFDGLNINYARGGDNKLFIVSINESSVPPSPIHFRKFDTPGLGMSVSPFINLANLVADITMLVEDSKYPMEGLFTIDDTIHTLHPNWILEVNMPFLRLEVASRRRLLL